MPGDIITHTGTRLIINGEPLKYTEAENQFSDGYKLMVEDLGDRKATIKLTKNREGDYIGGHGMFNITIPQGHYLMMGDNRNNSSDGREWGFVAEKDIVGRAEFVIFNTKFWGNDKRSVKEQGMRRI